MNTRTHALIAFFWSALVASFAPVVAQDCVKSVRWDDHAPYGYKAPDGSGEGLHTKLMQEALKRTGCSMRLIEMPWPRALLELKSGRLDLLPGAANLPEREAFAYFSKPTNSSRTVLFISKRAAKKFTITKLADTVGTGFRIAVPRDASLGDEYDALLKNPAFTSQLTYITKRDSGWRMMELGRVEGLLTDEIVGLVAMRQLGLEGNIQRSKVVTSTESDYVAISKASNDAAFVKRFNAALDSMVADGTYLKLLQTYLPCTISIDKLGCK